MDTPAHRFAPGADALARALAADLPADVVRPDAPVTAISRRTAGGLEVRTPSSVLCAEDVVVAVPPALALARIDFGSQMPPGLARLARTTPVWMGTVAKVVARYPAPFWRDAGLVGAAVSRTGPLRELHDMSGPGGRPAALFGFAPAQTVGPDFEQAVTAQLTRLFGSAAAQPETLHIQNWSGEPWTAPPTVHHLTDYSLFGHPLYRQPALEGRLHWAATETATQYAGHIEGALAAAERAVTAALTTKETNPCSR
ncbi:FAD-dependent oxidoreductase [Streptomyces sp. NPDC094149]|uniref:flavin monoamine oxidase family protein n=1 Tax=Streptomyces sp. NPDC094149 TaxID=3155079 RepID=UPI00332B4809